MFLLQSPPFCVTIKHANNQQQGVLFYMNIPFSLRPGEGGALVYDLQFLTEGHFVHHSSDFHASDEHRGVRNLYGLSVLAADFDDYDIAVPV